MWPSSEHKRVMSWNNCRLGPRNGDARAFPDLWLQSTLARTFQMKHAGRLHSMPLPDGLKSPPLFAQVISRENSF